MGKVVELNTKLHDGIHIPAAKVLTEAIGDFDNLVLVGVDKNGKLRIRATDGFAVTALMLARAHAKMISGYDD